MPVKIQPGVIANLIGKSIVSLGIEIDGSAMERLSGRVESVTPDQAPPFRKSHGTASDRIEEKVRIGVTKLQPFAHNPAILDSFNH